MVVVGVDVADVVDVAGVLVADVVDVIIMIVVFMIVDVNVALPIVNDRYWLKDVEGCCGVMVGAFGNYPIHHMVKNHMRNVTQQ